LSGKASLRLQNPVPTVTSISPSSLGVGNFSITMTGKNFVSGAKVMFGGQALTTKFVSSTQLTATGMTTAARQRIAWALAEIFVVSNQKIGDASAFTSWMNMLQKDAFGNFATLLNDVTLSPTMGNYLDMVNNDKPDPTSGREPNENYAREILQLFSIGLAELNPDGTPQLDGNGIPVPTYTQDTIIGFAHVFTGWTYPTEPGNQARFFNPEYYGGPMISFDSHHDTGTKLLLNGVTLPAEFWEGQSEGETSTVCFRRWRPAARTTLLVRDAGFRRRRSINTLRRWRNGSVSQRPICRQFSRILRISLRRRWR
jgi:hypothetical protein